MQEKQGRQGLNTMQTMTAAHDDPNLKKDESSVQNYAGNV